MATAKKSGTKLQAAKRRVQAVLASQKTTTKQKLSAVLKTGGALTGKTLVAFLAFLTTSAAFAHLLKNASKKAGVSVAIDLAPPPGKIRKLVVAAGDTTKTLLKKTVRALAVAGALGAAGTALGRKLRRGGGGHDWGHDERPPSSPLLLPPSSPRLLLPAPPPPRAIRLPAPPSSSPTILLPAPPSRTTSRQWDVPNSQWENVVRSPARRKNAWNAWNVPNSEWENVVLHNRGHLVAPAATPAATPARTPARTPSRLDRMLESHLAALTRGPQANQHQYMP